MRDRRRSRGYRAERNLVIRLWRLGFAVLRAPASGAKIKRADYPDIVAIKNGKIAVFEVKSRKELSTIYIKEEQLRKLKTFTQRAGGRAYIAVKIPRIEWKFIPIEELERTPKGRYRVHRDTIAKSPGLEKVLADLGLLKTLKDYIKNKGK